MLYNSLIVINSTVHFLIMTNSHADNIGRVLKCLIIMAQDV